VLHATVSFTLAPQLRHRTFSVTTLPSRAAAVVTYSHTRWRPIAATSTTDFSVSLTNCVAILWHRVITLCGWLRMGSWHSKCFEKPCGWPDCGLWVQPRVVTVTPGHASALCNALTYAQLWNHRLSHQVGRPLIKLYITSSNVSTAVQINSSVLWFITRR
jgi:hypothetical protein